jgi:O-antigen/teichoic acid export membrane protein
MSTRRALFFSFLDRYSGLVLSVASSMVVARLLTPDDFGVFAVASALLMLASAVRDMGAGQYLVQAPQLDEARIRAVWTLQFGMGLALALIVAALAVPAAWFYREDRMTPVLLVMACSFAVNPFGAITYSMLMRQMRFQHLALMRFSANLVGAATTVGLAYRGWGPTSLAVGAFAGTAANAVAAQAFRDRGMPWGLGLAKLPEVLRFGGRIAGTQVVNSVLLATPDFALGRLQSILAAGLYSRSNGLVGMFNRLVTDAVFNVAVALFSEQNRAGRPVADGMLKAVSYLTVLHWVFAAHVILLAAPLTMVLYGPQWGDTVALTRLLALAGAFTAPVPICIAVATALGRADRVFATSLAIGGLTATAALAGASLSLTAMVLGLVAAALVSGLSWLALACRLAACPWPHLLRVLAQSALAAGLCALVPVGTVLAVGLRPASPWLVLIGDALGGGLILILALAATAHPLSAEITPLLQRVRLWPQGPRRGRNP